MPATSWFRGIDSERVECVLHSALTGLPVETPEDGVVPPGCYLAREVVACMDRDNYQARSFYGPGATWGSGCEVVGEPLHRPPYTVLGGDHAIRWRGWREGEVVVQRFYLDHAREKRPSWHTAAALPGGHPVARMLADGQPAIAADYVEESGAGMACPHRTWGHPEPLSAEARAALAAALRRVSHA